MYMKDKSTRITLRLNEEQFSYLKSSADVLGVSPSEFLRMVINATLVSAKDGTLQQAVRKGLEAQTKEEARRENETSDKHDQL